MPGFSMTVTEVTTIIAIVGTATLIGLLVLPKRLGSTSHEDRRGRFVTVPVAPVPPAAGSLRDGLIRSGRGGTRFVALAVIATVGGTAIGLVVSLLLVVARNATGLGAG